MRLVAAFDKFRGTLTASEAGDVVTGVARRHGWDAVNVAMADGGEGFLDVLGGGNRHTLVTGPLGDPVRAAWRIDGRTAVIEMAQASGLSLAGGIEHNDPLSASTYGTGELIHAAVDAGADRVLVGVGGSATTDGGLGAVRALYPHERLRRAEIVVACDVNTHFLDAAELFAPQKGATPVQVRLLSARLGSLAESYANDYRIDITTLPGGGAAGGLAGGLAALGAELVSGFEVVAEEVELRENLVGADLVVTGEGHLDEESFDGKVVGGVARLAAELGVPVLVVAGNRDPGAGAHLDVQTLSDEVGVEQALAHPGAPLEAIIDRWLDQFLRRVRRT